jgi:hypothetical protein
VEWAGIATRYGLKIETRWRRISHTRPDRPRGPPSLLRNGYRASFPGLKWPGRDVNHHPHVAEVKEIVELYPYLPFGHSWPVLGWTLPFTLGGGEWATWCLGHFIPREIKPWYFQPHSWFGHFGQEKNSYPSINPVRSVVRFQQISLAIYVRYIWINCNRNTWISFGDSHVFFNIFYITMHWEMILVPHSACCILKQIAGLLGKVSLKQKKKSTACMCLMIELGITQIHYLVCCWRGLYSYPGIN